jgi:uncharacterized protein YrrD
METSNESVPAEARVESRKLIGSPLIVVTNGEMIGKVKDIEIDPSALRAVAVVTSTGTLLHRETEGVLAENVNVWGQDAILVKQPDVIVTEDRLDSRDGWMSADDLNHFDVVGEDGRRVGKLKDVVIDTHGQIMGYELAQVAIEGRIAAANYIDVKATHSLGRDVLVIKSEYL